MVCSSMILHGGSNAEKNSEDAWKRRKIMKATVRILRRHIKDLSGYR